MRLKRSWVSRTGRTLAVLAGVVVYAALAQAQTTYAFGVLPQFTARERAETWQPILDELSRRTGLSLLLKGSQRIPEFDATFVADEFDLAYVNPLMAATAMLQKGYVPLVRDRNDLYGILAVRKDSPYRKAGDLAGQKIAFPAPHSVGASLLIQADLADEYKIAFTQFIL